MTPSKNKKVAIIQSNYIPWKGYFDIINSVDEFVIYDDVQYTKRDWRNRNQIKTSTGLIWLTIPVEVKGKFFQTIKETKIADPNWPKKHLKSIQINYAKAAFYKEYFPFFENLYSNCNYNYLSEINYFFLEAICKLFNIKSKISFSSDYKLEGEKNYRLINICNQANANIYVSGPSAKNYIDEELFLKNGIKVEWFSYEGYPEYPQLYPPFTHYVSIIDVIFNVGPDIYYITKQKQQ